MNSIRMMSPLLVVLLLAAPGHGQGYPKPSAASERWELHFMPGDLRIYIDPIDEKPYWYFTYTVENRTGEDQVWAPRFVLFTDAGELRTSGQDVPLRVTNDLIDLLGNELLENQNEIIGELLQGRENARDGIVIWPIRETNVTELSVFISGTSGETAEIHNPITGERMLLRKTLQRDYHIPGDPIARGSRPAQLVDQRWIFR